VPVKRMSGEPSSLTSRQPERSTACDPGLYSSIHSSLALAEVPAQAISLMRMVGVVVLVLLVSLVLLVLLVSLVVVDDMVRDDAVGDSVVTGVGD